MCLDQTKLKTSHQGGCWDRQRPEY